MGEREEPNSSSEGNPPASTSTPESVQFKMDSSSPGEANSTLDLQEDPEKQPDADVPVNYVPLQERSDLVEFEGADDPENPRNWPTRKKWAITASMGGMTFVVTFSSSVYASPWQLNSLPTTY